MSYREVQAAVMGRLMKQADDDLTEASDMARSLRDGSVSGGEARADFRYAAEKMDEARVALQAARERLGL
jgi:hypothetical protein